MKILSVALLWPSSRLAFLSSGTAASHPRCEGKARDWLMMLQGESSYTKILLSLMRFSFHLSLTGQTAAIVQAPAGGAGRGLKQRYHLCGIWIIWGGMEGAPPTRRWTSSASSSTDKAWVGFGCWLQDLWKQKSSDTAPTRQNNEIFRARGLQSVMLNWEFQTPVQVFLVSQLCISTLSFSCFF